MIRLAARSILTRPVRSAVLIAGFGVGVGAMAGLLGVGDVIVDQADRPALDGGGDLVVHRSVFGIDNGRYRLATRIAPIPGVVAAAPTKSTGVHWRRADGRVLSFPARGGIPSLEKAIGDPEVVDQPDWLDAPTDRTWTEPDVMTLLAEMDRFHSIPDAPDWADSWAEWDYFNGKSGDLRFYLTLLAGPAIDEHRRRGGVRLQLDIGGRKSVWWESVELDERALIDSSPALDFGPARLSIAKGHWVVDLDLPGSGNDPRPLRGQIDLDGTKGHAIPPLELLGSRGWVSGYTVPILQGRLSGHLEVDGIRHDLDGGSGYHDHNWGFWRGVTWRWGQVSAGDVSIVYGRVIPPLQAADPDRVPAILLVVDDGGPLATLPDPTFTEDLDEDGVPSRIHLISAAGSDLLEMTFVTRSIERNPLGFSAADDATELLQLSGEWTVEGEIGGRQIRFTSAGSAETFRPGDAGPTVD